MIWRPNYVNEHTFSSRHPRSRQIHYPEGTQTYLSRFATTVISCRVPFISSISEQVRLHINPPAPISQPKHLLASH